VQDECGRPDLAQPLDNAVALDQCRDVPQETRSVDLAPFRLPVLGRHVAEADAGDGVDQLWDRPVGQPCLAQTTVGLGDLRVFGGSRSAHQHQGRDALGRLQRHPQGNEAALARAGHDRGTDAQLIHDREDVGGDVPVGEIRVRQALAVPALVDRDTPVARSEGVDLRAEHRPVHREAVQKHDSRAVAPVVGEADPLSGGGGDRGHESPP
jgi:hypothetical protein